MVGRGAVKEALQATCQASLAPAEDDLPAGSCISRQQGPNMTKAFVLDWHIPVDKQLLEGEVFDRWSEEEVEEGCRFKVDENGFFICWKSEGREGEVLDLSQVSLTGKEI